MDLLEAIRQNFDTKTLTIFTVCLVAAIAAVLWFINKTTGRPMRDMIALVGACIIVIAFIFVVFSMQPKDATGRPRPILFSRTMVVAFGAGVAWLFNKLVSTRPGN